jgi:transmembrane sensor
MNLKNNIHELIVRQLSGEALPDDNEFIKKWLSESHENKKLYNDLKDIWLLADSDANTDEIDVEEAICNFRFRTQMQPDNLPKKSFLTSLFRYAALVIFILAIPFTWWLALKSLPSQDNYTTVWCDYGDKTTITLPDSSQVWLNAGSQLTFNNNFNESRQLYLNGEAYFSVKENQEIPFVVNASDMHVKVLGTEFNFKAYTDEETFAVTLVEGSLQVRNSSEIAMVIPGQKLIYEAKSHTMTIEDLNDLAPETDWKNGRLVFRNESLEELERKLERWFDVEVEFADELVKSRRFSGTLGRQSILEVISYFATSQYVDYKIDGNIITFFSEN